MKWWEILLSLFGIAFSIFVYIKSYYNIFSKDKKSLNLYKILIIAFVTITMFFNTFYNYYNFSKIIISFVEIVLLLWVVTEDNIKYVQQKSMILYLAAWISEMILGIIYFYFPIVSLEEFNSNVYFKVMFSILTMLLVLLTTYFPFCKRIYNKLYYYMKKILTFTILITMLILTITILTFYLIITKNITSYLTLITLILVMIITLIIALMQIVKTNKESQKSEALLEFIKKYEIIIDKERIDRHEMVNNLLVLKSIKNKNTKNYNKILDDILSTYKSSNHIRNLYNLPSGLKGMFYYKIYEMQDKNITVVINISDEAIKVLDRLNEKDLSKLCKILGIILDNAKDAALISKDKIVVIDVYDDDKSVIIYIENTFDDKNVDMAKLKEKGFSTKGKNRGYGLYLVDKLLSKNKKIFLNQHIENKNFISIIEIKK